VPMLLSMSGAERPVSARWPARSRPAVASGGARAALAERVSGPGGQVARDAQGHDSIVVFVDRLSKMAHLVATSESLTLAAQQSFNNVVKLHRVPYEMVSDRGPQFSNQFWGSVCELLGVQRSMSSAHHPQSDGQTERTIRTITEMLRLYVRPDQTDWTGGSRGQRLPTTTPGTRAVGAPPSS